MRLYLFENRVLCKGVMGWCVALCALTGMVLTLYPMFRSLNFDFGQLFASLPANLQAFLGMTGLDASRFTAYLAFPLKSAQELTAIGGLVLGATAATHDVRQGCADFLYAKPLSRSRILTVKLLAVVTAAAVLFGVFLLFLLGARQVLAPREPFPLSSALAASSLPALIFLLYAAAGLLLGVAFPRVRFVGAIGLGAMCCFHGVLRVGTALTGTPQAPLVRALVPVCLFDRTLAAGTGQLQWPYLALWSAEVLVLVAAALWVLRRRDIQ